MSKKKSLERPARPVITNAAEARMWASSRAITEIECVVPDLAGVARSKIMPA